jgi:hypothetical protein
VNEMSDDQMALLANNLTNDVTDEDFNEQFYRFQEQNSSHAINFPSTPTNPLHLNRRETANMVPV